jgi:peptidoglycan/LPS O-acetylase OafA/YrhL
MPPTAERNAAIDLLRVLCIGYIVGFWHLIPYTDWLPGYANPLTEAIKDIALGTFVFASGLLLARRDLPPRVADWLGFFRRRLVRLYPLYLLALILFAVVGLASQATILKGALLISMFAPPPPPTLWFVTMIMVFYLLAPLLIGLAGDGRRYLIVSAGIVLLCLVYDGFVQSMDSRLVLFFPAFALGVYVQRVRAGYELLQRRRLYLLLLLPLAFVLGLPGDRGFDIATALLRAPLVSLGAVLLVIYAERAGSTLHSPSILMLSYASLGVYLFHRPVFELVMALYYPVQGHYQALYLMGVAVPLTFLIAYAVQRTYDAGVARLRPVTAQPLGASGPAAGHPHLTGEGRTQQ